MRDSVTGIALVDPSPANRDSMRNLLLGIDWVTLEAECSHYDQVPAVLDGAEFGGVIIALDSDPTKALELVQGLAQEYPALAIIVISGRPDLLVQAHRCGARALIDDPVQLEDLLRALKALAAEDSPFRTGKSQVISVLSTRGGVGCTSLAVNLGCCFAAQAGTKVVLIDIDLTMGSADIALGLEPERRLTDMATSIERMDLQLVRGSLARHSSGLLLLPRPAQLHDIGLLHEEHIQRMLRLLRLLSTHVIVDLGKGWMPTDLQALHMADSILMVIQPDLASVRSAVLMLTALTTEGLDGKVLLIMNRAGAYFGQDSISIKKAEEVIGRLVYWQIPNDYKVLMDAWNAGVPLIQAAPRSKAHLTITALADDLNRRFNRTEVTRPKKQDTKMIKVVLPPKEPTRGPANGPGKA